MPRPSTGNLAQPSVDLMGHLLSVLTAGDPFVVFALGHPSDLSHLILAKRLVHRDLLL